jgi:hypothetical protein
LLEVQNYIFEKIYFKIEKIQIIFFF